MLTGTWTPLTHLIPTATPGTMELLSDGSVMITVNTAKDWEKLTPDASGSYVNGTWSSLASMSTLRLYDATNVLQDGRVLVLGGQYTDPPYTQTNTNTGEIYNPLTNRWSNITPFPEPTFGASATTLLSDGRLLAGSPNGPQTYIYDPATDSWSPGPTKLDNDASSGGTWTKLADGSILSYDALGSGPRAQRLDPATNSWIDSGTVPDSLLADPKRNGPAVLLPDGRVFMMFKDGTTALYTPSVTPGGSGTWEAGPVIPGGLGMNLSSAAMMPNGHVLFDAGGSVDGPVHFFEFDPNAPVAT